MYFVLAIPPAKDIDEEALKTMEATIQVRLKPKLLVQTAFHMRLPFQPAFLNESRHSARVF
jgi:hypothetical protein